MSSTTSYDGHDRIESLAWVARPLCDRVGDQPSPGANVVNYVETDGHVVMNDETGGSL